eukprot:CAMPEP_0184500706 /NCGR_PEP_ID=MMETSP0113_2-20130426/45556_1 /TAXON_ID=91329 /ORGANISM="Norrisiella sphaerica, Strain BC52" /LENGTH=56 /DNA_ID=CAMNT_0026889191 /DNA_START=109 /DNA_END=276 /DNA_ORIENTATION=+
MGICASDANPENIFMQEKYADYKVLFSRRQLDMIFDQYDKDENDLLQLEELERMTQ